MRALIALLAFAPAMMADVWHGIVTSNGLDIPFEFELQGKGADVKGTFFNGEERFTSTSGNLTGDALTLKWEYFAATLTARVDGNVIDGTYDRARSTPMHVRLTKTWQRQVTVPGNTPSINGRWVLENVKSSKGESAWH